MGGCYWSEIIDAWLSLVRVNPGTVQRLLLVSSIETVITISQILLTHGHYWSLIIVNRLLLLVREALNHGHRRWSVSIEP